MSKLLTKLIVITLLVSTGMAFFPSSAEAGSTESRAPANVGQQLRATAGAVVDVAFETRTFLSSVGNITKHTVEMIWSLSPAMLGLMTCLGLPLFMIGLKAITTLDRFLRSNG